MQSKELNRIKFDVNNGAPDLRLKAAEEAIPVLRQELRRLHDKAMSQCREFAATLDTPEVNDRLVGLGLTVPKSSANTVADLTRHIDEFAATYGKLIAEMGIKAE